MKFKRGKLFINKFWGVAANSWQKQSKVVSICFALTRETEQIKLVNIVGSYYYCCSSVYCYSLSFELRYNQLYLLRYTINLSNRGTQPQWEASSQVRRSRSGRKTWVFSTQACQTNERHIKEPMEHWTNCLVSTNKKYIHLNYAVYETIVQLSQL